tara:strand:+ start:571 stop:1272 length:702 start_codon:yes stop_codon:yes gene_type:complete
MKKGWLNVWQKKSNLPFSKNYKILFEMNGWDSGVSSFSFNDWKRFINSFIEKFKITESKNVLEIGCGSGIFLLPFYKRNINCFGTDYSSKFIKNCKKLMTKGVFIRSEANNLDKLKKYKFDFIFIHSVFQYFDNIRYASEVLNQLKAISRKGTKIFILDVPNIKKKRIWENDMIKKIGVNKFKKKYSKLKHLFYSKSFFEKFCKKNNFSLNNISKFKLKKQSSEYRFNLMIKV